MTYIQELLVKKQTNKKNLHFFLEFCSISSEFLPVFWRFCSRIRFLIKKTCYHSYLQKQRHILQSAKAFVCWINLRRFWLSLIKSTLPVQSHHWGEDFQSLSDNDASQRGLWLCKTLLQTKHTCKYHYTSFCQCKDDFKSHVYDQRFCKISAVTFR